MVIEREKLQNNNWKNRFVSSNTHLYLKFTVLIIYRQTATITLPYDSLIISKFENVAELY